MFNQKQFFCSEIYTRNIIKACDNSTNYILVFMKYSGEDFYRLAVQVINF